ncbi:class I SAM-dependent methyltransferase [Thiocapsa rosea]|uniref:Methyltransferase family protein n=1 Tax=Thiocapsa rosea TaxID=69360 RepID=A0A495V141_9GAMM|nr:class I SAM-dependent methyltransferase [Thiocapsa rosea]RKT42999.1 methyltransferase family protein [Thiocapsa rosea]
MTHPTSPNTPDDFTRSWDARYEGATAIPKPALVLRQWPHLLPEEGTALDLACGLGGNALWLAERGFRVSAWDLSHTAIARLRDAARLRGLHLDARVRDLTALPPSPESFDLILVAHFLDRDLAPSIAAALRPDGLLFYQTFARECRGSHGPSNPAYRLARNELISLFPDLTIRAYRAEGPFATPESGLRDLALMVAQRI